MSKKNDDAILRMLDAAQEVIRNGVDLSKLSDSSMGSENIIDQLTSDEGYSPKPMFEPPVGADALGAAMQLMSAYYAADNFKTDCQAILRLKSISTETKAEWTRGLAWHFSYVLRERCRVFVNVLRDYAQVNPSLAEEIQELAKRFKKNTDSLLTTRGKHVHNHEIEDPLVGQIKLIELLATNDESGVWTGLRSLRQPAIKQHLKRSVEDGTSKMLHAANTLVGDSERVWRVIFDAMAKDKSPRKKRR